MEWNYELMNCYPKILYAVRERRKVKYKRLEMMQLQADSEMV